MDSGDEIDGCSLQVSIHLFILMGAGGGSQSTLYIFSMHIFGEQSIQISVDFVVKSLSCVWPFVTPWTVAYQAPLSMGFPQARILECVAISYSRFKSLVHLHWFIIFLIIEF